MMLHDVSTDTEAIEILAHAAASFGELNAFRTAISAIPGIQQVQPRGIEGGALRLAVTYQGIIPLDARLRAGCGARWRAIETTEGSVRVWLN